MSKIVTGRSSGSYLNDISGSSTSVSPDSFTYDGNPKTPTVMVTYEDEVLTPNDDYSVTYVDNVSSGTAKAIIEGRGRYVGSRTASFKIESPISDNDLSEAEITLSVTSYVYTGSAFTPVATVKLNGSTLIQNVDYTVQYVDNTSIGIAKVVVTALGNYTGSSTKTFSIVKPDLSNSTITLNAYVFSYTGSLVRPVVTVRMDVGGSTVTLQKSVDYTVSYKDNGKRGTAKAIVTGMGSYTGSKTVEFQIGKDLSSAVVSLTSEEYPYTGADVTPEPVVTLAGSPLTKGVDYRIEYTDNREIGIGRVNVVGINDYIGTATANMSIDTTEDDAWDSLRFNNSNQFYPVKQAYLRVPIFPSGNILVSEYGMWQTRSSSDSSNPLYGYTNAPFYFNGVRMISDTMFMASVPIVDHLYRSSASNWFYKQIGSTSYISPIALFEWRKSDTGEIFSLDSDANGNPLYLNPVPISVTSPRKRINGSWYHDDNYMNDYGGTYCIRHFHPYDYGRRLLVPLALNRIVNDTNSPLGQSFMANRSGWSFYPTSYEALSGYNDGDPRETDVTLYHRNVCSASLSTVYDLDKYGPESVLYTHTDGLNYSSSMTGLYRRTNVFAQMFSGDGKIYTCFYRLYNNMNSCYQRRMVLMTPFDLSSSSQTTDINVFSALESASGTRVSTRVIDVQFSPNGKNAAVITSWNNSTLLLVKMSIPFDLSSCTSVMNPNIAGINGTQLRAYSDMNRGISCVSKGSAFVVAKEKKLIVIGSDYSNESNNVTKMMAKILEYDLS